MTHHEASSGPSKVLDRLPGGERVTPRKSVQARMLATLVAAAWPPILLTFPLWPPHHLWAGLDTDWRIVLLVVGLIAGPIGMARLAQAKRPNNATWTRRAVVARYVIYGGILAGCLQLLMTVAQSTIAALSGESFVQALGAMQVVVLVYGVLGIPLALMVGVSYALWGGLCVAYIAYRKSDTLGY
ncbi:MULTISPECIES: hypothetical protein [unclassified Brevundimonas]|uniref:hypothetical protein n=1 Tax=unclassified Brevundimonas TaxID=2622653 RepID=UPI0025C48BD1|nr:MULTISPECIES: hypothetical protein [unclassified Brevundimonas]